MAPSPPRLRILSVGGNAVSAFLSWRLQATNACDVTLVWKSGYDAVAQYGISMKSQKFGNERFKPLSVVRSPEDASGRKAAFDYVLLCVKALPDVYDLASIIESVVTPQHTCILVNTSNTLGVEEQLEKKYPTNVVLSLVSEAEVSQLGASEFEHNGATQVWVGPANKNDNIPGQIQLDMAEALAMTLSTGQVECSVSHNIRQQQFERMIGPIAFHPASVLFEVPSHAELMQKKGVSTMIEGLIDELISLATKQGCTFAPDFKTKLISDMIASPESQSIMYQDFLAKRPMEIETYLGAPIQLAAQFGASVPRISTMYAIMHNFNVVNQQARPAPAPAAVMPPASPAMTMPHGGPPPGYGPRTSMGPGPRAPPHGAPPYGMPNGRSRAPSMGGRRGGPPMNGPPRAAGGYPGRSQNNLSRRPSFEQNDFADEFAHVVLYDDIPEGQESESTTDIVLRERELALRQRELQLREQEMAMGGMRGGRRRGKPAPSHRDFDDDDDDDELYDAPGPMMPAVDAENFDMMSVTSRKARRAPADQGAIRRDPNMGFDRMSGMPGMRQSHSFGPGNMRPSMNRHRVSARIMSDMPGLHENLMDNPLLGFTDNRYGNVDRKTLGNESRANSLTQAKLDELSGGGMNGMPGGMPGMHGGYPAPRRTSVSPGDGFNPGPGRRVSSRPSPPNGAYLAPNGMPMNRRPSPPGAIGRPMPPRHASINGGPGPHPSMNGAPMNPQVNGGPMPQQYMANGVSKLGPGSYPPQKNDRSLTGSASASAGSGESANIESEPSAHSSQSSFAPRQPLGVR